MKVNSVQTSNPSFGKILNGSSITRILRKRHVSNSFIYERDKIEDMLVAMGINSKRNVDVILNYSASDGFYGVISSKKQGVPKHSDNKHKISLKFEDTKKFFEWVERWEERLSSSNVVK